MPPPIVCFADFDYPRSCESWAIVPVALSAVNATGTSPEFRCVNPAETALAECSVILGLETRMMTTPFVAGPAYNVSWGLKAIMGDDDPTGAAVHGWDFLKPFTWEVWVVFASCAIAACCSQLLMRWLDIRRRKTSPDAVPDVETVRDVALASFTSLIGSSRLFEYYEGPYMRHVASMIMAVFSVFIMALYSSNLTAFSFPESEATATARSLTDAREYAVHRGFVDYARRGMASVFANTDSTIREISVMGNERNVVAPDVWLASRCTPRRHLTDVFPMTILYEVMYNNATYHDRIAETSSAIVGALSRIRSVPSCEPHPPSRQRLGLGNVWGVFAIAGVGFAAAVAFRAFVAFREKPRLPDTAIDMFGNSSAGSSASSAAFESAVESASSAGFEIVEIAEKNVRS